MNLNRWIDWHFSAEKNNPRIIPGIDHREISQRMLDACKFTEPQRLHLYEEIHLQAFNKIGSSVCAVETTDFTYNIYYFPYLLIILLTARIALSRSLLMTSISSLINRVVLLNP